MGCALAFIAVLGIIIALVFLPSVQTFIADYIVNFPEGWDFMEAIVVLIPLMFLVIAFFGAFKFISR